MDLSSRIFFFFCFGYPRSAPSIFHNILAGANMIVVLSHLICEFAYIGVSMLVFKSKGALLEQFLWKFEPALVLDTTFEVYHAKAIYVISWLSSQVVENHSSWLWGSGTILVLVPCFSIKLFTLSAHCPLNMSEIKSHFLIEQRSSSTFLFLT